MHCTLPPPFLLVSYFINSPRRVLYDVAIIYIANIPMLYTIAVVLLVLWLLGLVTSYTLGGFVHLLLVVAIIMVLIRLIQGKNPVA